MLTLIPTVGQGQQFFFFKEPDSKLVRFPQAVWPLLELLGFAIVTQKQLNNTYISECGYVPKIPYLEKQAKDCIWPMGCTWLTSVL